MKTDELFDITYSWLGGSVVERRSLIGELSLASPDLQLMVTIYMGKPSAVGQPTRPTQPFILMGSSAGSITVHSVVAPPGELRGKGGMVYLQCKKLCDPC